MRNVSLSAIIDIFLLILRQAMNKEIGVYKLSKSKLAVSVNIYFPYKDQAHTAQTMLENLA